MRWHRSCSPHLPTRAWRHDRTPARTRRRAVHRPRRRRLGVLAPFTWLAQGWSDFRARPLPSMFYGVCFAVMGWLIALTFRHAYEYVSALVTGFFLVGPFLATGLYALSQRRERGEPVWLAPTLDAWRPTPPRSACSRWCSRWCCSSGRGRRWSCSRCSTPARCRACTASSSRSSRSTTSSSCSRISASAASSRCSCSRSAWSRCR